MAKEAPHQAQLGTSPMAEALGNENTGLIQSLLEKGNNQEVAALQLVFDAMAGLLGEQAEATEAESAELAPLSHRAMSLHGSAETLRQASLLVRNIGHLTVGRSRQENIETILGLGMELQELQPIIGVSSGTLTNWRQGRIGTSRGNKRVSGSINAFGALIEYLRSTYEVEDEAIIDFLLEAPGAAADDDEHNNAALFTQNIDRIGVLQRARANFKP
jgi:hypothetical protein